jgi:hypothetical protein
VAVARRLLILVSYRLRDGGIRQELKSIVARECAPLLAGVKARSCGSLREP